VSVIIGRRTLFLYNLHDQDNPIELAFQQRYGALIIYRWYAAAIAAQIFDKLAVALFSSFSDL